VPRVRKNPRRGRRVSGGITLYQRAYLLTGQCYDFLVGDRDVVGRPFADGDAVRLAWASHSALVEGDCADGAAPWARYVCESKAKTWALRVKDALKKTYLGGFTGHEWVCEYVKSAVEHVDWAEIRASVKFDWRWIRTWNDVEAVKRGCYFDENAGFYAVGFFRLLRHCVGEWAGKPFEPLNWQKFDLLMPLFGWMRKSGTRRFRKAHVEIPKKNGKSMICSGLSLKLAIADREASAEVYNAAGEKEQAEIVFGEAEKMAKASPFLEGRIKWTPSRKRGEHLPSGSTYRALSKEHKNKDGYKTSGLVIDELHMQQDRKLWDVLIYGGRTRRQPMFISITTAGEYDPHGIGWEQHTYARRLLSGDGGIGRDPYFFAYIRSVPEELKERWMEPDLWYRANPNLGVTIDFEQFEAEAQEALNMPSKVSSFQRYSLNIWVRTREAAFKIEKWNSRAVSGDGLERVRMVEELAQGRRCFGGLDLAAVNDLSAAALWFPPNSYEVSLESGGESLEEEEDAQTGMSESHGVDDCHLLLTWFWLPVENIGDLEKQHNAPYSQWADEGWLNLTPGEVADYKTIRRDLVEIHRRFEPERWNYDKWSAAQLVSDLIEYDDLPMVEFGQGFGWMNAPTKEFERLMIQERIIHAAHPTMDWMVGNCQMVADGEGKVKLVKQGKKIAYKIDGPIAAVEALDGAVRCAAGVVLTGSSVYVG